MGWLLGSIVVVPAIRFYSYIVRYVRKDGRLDQLNNGDVPVKLENKIKSET